MRSKLFADKYFNKTLYKLTLPIAIQSLMLAAVAAADALMLGAIEQNAMTAVSLATQIQFVQNMILGSVTAGIAILGAQYWGKKDVSAILDIFNMSLRLCALTSIAFFIGCIFFPQYLMLLFTDDPVLIEIGCKYLRITGWSYLLTGISQCYLTIMKVTDHVSMTAIITICTVLINIVLNAVFIFGFDMNAQGAAIATLIARVVELVWAFAMSLQKGYIKPKLSRLLRRNALLEQDFFKCFLPILGASLLWGIGFTSYTSFMGHLGVDAAAANSVASVMRDLVCCLCNGIATGAGILIGNELGAGNLEKGREYGDKCMKLAAWCGAISTILMFALTPLIMSFVKLTPEAHSYLLGMMLIMAVYMYGRAYNTIVINGIFSAGGDTKFDMYSLAITMWCMAVPLAALGTFVFHWSPLLVYAFTCLDEVGKIPWVIYHFNKHKWVKDLTRNNLTEQG